jgi:hypothetical protein
LTPWPEKCRIEQQKEFTMKRTLLIATLLAVPALAQTTYNVQTCVYGQPCTNGQVTVTPRTTLDTSIILRSVSVADVMAQQRQADLNAQLLQQQIELQNLALKQMKANEPKPVRYGWLKEGKFEYYFTGGTESVARIGKSKRMKAWLYQFNHQGKPEDAKFATKEEAKLAVENLFK